MTGEDWTAIAQGTLAIAGTVGGVLFVMRLVVLYQRDFTDRYANEVRSQRADLDDQHKQIDALSRVAVEAKVDAEAARLAAAKATTAVQECEARERRLVAALAEAGVDLPPLT